MQLKNWTGLSNFEEMYNVVAETFKEGKNISWKKIIILNVRKYMAKRLCHVCQNL